MNDNVFVLNHIKCLEHLDYICYSDISLKIIGNVSKYKSLWKILWNYVTVMPDHWVWTKISSQKK